jgi:hypothetical protein
MKYFLIFYVLVLVSCNDSGTSNNATAIGSSTTSDNGSQNKQLNLTILLDLSDRIDPKTSPDKPEHYQKDISLINYFSDYFIKEMEKKGTYLAKGKMKIIFSPKPQDPNINIAAEKLDVDLSKMDTKQKKEIHENLEHTVNDNITNIYQTTLKESKWIGSDVWRFFKNDVKDYAVENDPRYRNVLIVLTDGYIYHSDSKDKNGNRYAYILPNLFQQYNLRNNPTWSSEIDKQNFGLISTRNDLENLEVLVLEVSPSPSYKNDEDIIKKVLSNWFNEMKVKRSAVFNSDLPEYTKKRIDDFLNVQ